MRLRSRLTLGAGSGCLGQCVELAPWGPAPPLGDRINLKLELLEQAKVGCGSGAG